MFHLTLARGGRAQYRIVYFATHGLVSGDLQKFAKNKIEPALVLSIPDKPTDFDDGLLTASEIAQLKLNADWVVLSACNTASSDGVGAEARSGLARAFLYAGARSLVVSHWDVSDEATTSLMSNLFEISTKNLGLPHGEAFREATLKLLNEAKTEENAHPRVWAPFIVVGEPAKRVATIQPAVERRDSPEINTLQTAPRPAATSHSTEDAAKEELTRRGPSSDTGPFAYERAQCLKYNIHSALCDAIEELSTRKQ